MFHKSCRILCKSYDYLYVYTCVCPFIGHLHPSCSRNKLTVYLSIDALLSIERYHTYIIRVIIIISIILYISYKSHHQDHWSLVCIDPAKNPVGNTNVAKESQGVGLNIATLKFSFNIRDRSQIFSLSLK